MSVKHFGFKGAVILNISVKKIWVRHGTLVAAAVQLGFWDTNERQKTNSPCVLSGV